MTPPQNQGWLATLIASFFGSYAANRMGGPGVVVVNQRGRGCMWWIGLLTILSVIACCCLLALASVA